MRSASNWSYPTSSEERLTMPQYLVRFTYLLTAPGPFAAHEEACTLAADAKRTASRVEIEEDPGGESLAVEPPQRGKPGS